MVHNISSCVLYCRNPNAWVLSIPSSVLFLRAAINNSFVDCMLIFQKVTVVVIVIVTSCLFPEESCGIVWNVMRPVV